MEDGYRAPQVCNLVGITYRQLDYWTRTGLVTSSVQAARGPGSQRLYSRADLLTLYVLKRLLDAGLSLKTIRRFMATLRTELDQGAEDLIIASDGVKVFGTRTPSALMDVLETGRGIFAVNVGVLAEGMSEQVGRLASIS